MPSNEPTVKRGLWIGTATLCVVLALVAAVSAFQAGQWRAQLERIKAAPAPSPAKAGATDARLRELLRQKDAEYAELQSAYDQLQNRLSAGSESSAATAAAAPKASAPAASAADSSARPRSWTDWMERVRQEDPARYQQILQWRQSRQQAEEQSMQKQMNSLAQRAQAAASPEEADIVNQVSTVLDQISQLRQARAQASTLPPDDQPVQMQQISDQLHQAYQQLDTLRQQDRAVQLQNLAASLGLQGQNAQALVDGVPQIYKNTQYSAPRGGPRGGGGATTPATTPAPTPATTTTPAK